MGSFEAALPAITNVCLYMFYYQKVKNDTLRLSKENFDAFAKLTSTANIELCWWDKHLTCSKDIFTESSELKIFSDACPTGSLVNGIPQEETGPQKKFVSILIH